MATPDSTREGLLDAAERLFAAAGVAATSVREITRHANANVAAVNYHFGSKSRLVREVLDRRLRPLNQERLARLTRLEAESATPDVASILDAFLRPAFELRCQLGPSGAPFARLMGRALSEPQLSSLLAETFHEVVERFSGALIAALPEAEPTEVRWRFFFLVGALAFVVNKEEMLCALAVEAEPDSERMLARLLDAGVASFESLCPVREAS